MAVVELSMGYQGQTIPWQSGSDLDRATLRTEGHTFVLDVCLCYGCDNLLDVSRLLPHRYLGDPREVNQSHGQDVGGVDLEGDGLCRDFPLCADGPVGFCLNLPPAIIITSIKSGRVDGSFPSRAPVTASQNLPLPDIVEVCVFLSLLVEELCPEAIGVGSSSCLLQLQEERSLRQRMWHWQGSATSTKRIQFLSSGATRQGDSCPQ